MTVLKWSSYPVKLVTSAWTNDTFVRPRSCAALVAAAMAVGLTSMPTTV
jgi:hypothetical protein